MQILQPTAKPQSACFSSGPTKKHKGWHLSRLDDTHLGRSHRAKAPKQTLSSAITRMASLLELPADYRLGIVPASDTGAVEMIMWSLLGQRGVDMLAWESFGKTWVNDAISQLQLTDIRVFDADWGKLPFLTRWILTAMCYSHGMAQHLASKCQMISPSQMTVTGLSLLMPHQLVLRCLCLGIKLILPPLAGKNHLAARAHMASLSYHRALLQD